VSKYDEEPAYTYTDVPALIEENERLRAVAQEVLSYTDYIRPLGPRGQVLRNAALAALDEEVGE
jgi:hypothetical protein